MNNIILEGIKEATSTINREPAGLINHSTDQLYYLEDIINKMGCGGVVLVKETYSNILMLEFETLLLSKAVKYNRQNIFINESDVDIIKNNCDDLLNKIGIIKEMQTNRVSRLSQQDFQRMAENEFDISI